MSKLHLESEEGPRLRRVQKRKDPAFTLRLVREGMSLTQSDLAQRGLLTQSEVSKIERRADALVSTLRTYAESIGGKLQLRLVVGEHSYLIELAEGE
jgi:transcriptional regulator with XRE-family HTH domain